MSIIGEYIHYDFSNYNEYGLNKVSTGIRNKPSYYEAVARQKKLILNKSKNLKSKRGTNKEELKRRLNFFRPNNFEKIEGTYTEKDIQEIENIICNIILEKLSKYNAELNFSDLSAISEGDSGLGVGLERGNLRWELSENGKNLVSAIVSRLKLLRNAINNMSNNKMENAEVLNSRLKKLEQNWEAIEEIFYENSPDKKVIQWSSIKNNPNTNFIHELNLLWLEFKRSIKSFVQGQLGEYYAALALAAASQVGKMGLQEIENYLKTSLENKSLGMSGFSSIKQGIGIDNFVVQGFTGSGKNLSQDILASRIMSGKGVKVQSVQGKVDLQITEEMYDLGNYNISIKNYSPNAGSLTIQSGENLIFKLTQSYPDFINHYLNITASGTPGLVNGGLIQIMNETLKLTLVVSGLVGDYFSIGGNLMADTLIYKKNNQFEVVFMDEIIQKIINNPSFAIISQLSNNKRWSAPWSGEISNYSYPEAYRRIVNILAQLNSFNVGSIKISTAAL